ncbi:MAG: lytic murein transglycosylase [Paracoccaceae bacterium]|jgi:lytic murein transglycosylase|nr:lytic murein transglycosylase [Paracoccaceae bacterium]
MRAPFLALILLLAALPAMAQDRAAVERQFRTWLEETVWPAARAAGVSRATHEAAFQGVSLMWDLPDLVPPGSTAPAPGPQRQGEFGSPAAYFAPNTVAATTRDGITMAQRHATTLARVEQQTGVPGRIILAIWGRESAFGRASIPHDAFAVLGTKGFMSTRAPYFTDELIAALQLVEARVVAPRGLRSSWAGALGQPQFMPSNVRAHARDGDGDGRADIWGSEADTIASIGAYLADHGWQKGRDWGFEVSVPATVSCALEGPDQGRPFADWAAMGITRTGGRPFPANELARDGFLLMPAGRFGPAFVVTQNFYVLKDYNMSDLYALFVGHVGDRIAYGMGDFQGQWGRVGGLMRADVAAMQTALQRMGHDTGGADGLAGFRTRRAIGAWQEATGQTPTCFPQAAMKAALR